MPQVPGIRPFDECDLADQRHCSILSAVGPLHVAAGPFSGKSRLVYCRGVKLIELFGRGIDFETRVKRYRWRLAVGWFSIRISAMSRQAIPSSR